MQKLPMIRTALGVLGSLGLLIWPTLSFLSLLFHNWKPGGSQGGLSVYQSGFCALTLISVSAYYVWVAKTEWRAGLFGAGIVLHMALFVAIVMLASFTDGGFLIAPVISIGPVLWMAYVALIRKPNIGA